MTLRTRLSVLLLLAAGPPLPVSRAAGPQPIAAFDDDAGDATGPGSYQKPGDSDLQDGDFDLRSFAVLLDGDDVLFKVTLGAPFRQPAVTARASATPVPLWSGLYYQNVDIYIDTDGAAPGYEACIPGRRVAFAGGRTWKVAVVLTPQPGLARSVTESALGEAGKHVLFPEHLQTQGRTVTARVPAAALGGPPKRSWAYSVHVSGARWERSFAVVDRIVQGRPEPDAFTMPVLGVVEAWAFGGAPDGQAHPRVVDVLLPRGVSQAAVLGSFDARTGAFARVPFVSLEPGPVAAAPAAPAAPPAPAFTVVDVGGKTIVVSGPVAGLETLRIGEILGSDGTPVAKLVVVHILEGGFVGNLVEGAGPVKRGAAVRFPPRD